MYLMHFHIPLRRPIINCSDDTSYTIKITFWGMHFWLTNISPSEISVPKVVECIKECKEDNETNYPHRSSQIRIGQLQDLVLKNCMQNLIFTASLLPASIQLLHECKMITDLNWCYIKEAQIKIYRYKFR